MAGQFTGALNPKQELLKPKRWLAKQLNEALQRASLLRKSVLRGIYQ